MTTVVLHFPAEDELGPIPDPGDHWPRGERWTVTQRLLAYWRWSREGHVTGAINARASCDRRAPWADIFKAY